MSDKCRWVRDSVYDIWRRCDGCIVTLWTPNFPRCFACGREIERVEESDGNV